MATAYRFGTAAKTLFQQPVSTVFAAIGKFFGGLLPVPPRADGSHVDLIHAGAEKAFHHERLKCTNRLDLLGCHRTLPVNVTGNSPRDYARTVGILSETPMLVR
jgi:hypothetical protein